MHIILVTYSLKCGGAERCAVLLAEGFQERGYKVSIVTITSAEIDFYKVPTQIDRLALNIAINSPTFIHAISNNWSRIGVLKKAITSLQPDLVISFLPETNILTLLALLKAKYLIFVSEQNNPDSVIGKVWKILRFLTYPLATKVVSCSQGVDAFFHWLPKDKRAVIYNPLAVVKEEKNENNLVTYGNPEKKWLITMGRLTYQKGYDILLSAFKKIAHKYPDWQLIILGEGELREEIENLRDNLHLTSQVIFTGLISNPFPLLRKAEIFVLSSRFEGFGNVLIEAMACGLPVISTDCPSGPGEIISDGKNGILVPNEDIASLAVAMDDLMSNEEKRKSLAIHAPEEAERFKLEKIISQWESLISEFVKE